MKSKGIFKKPLTIGLVGTHYTGKTTLSVLLKKELGATVLKEKFWANPFFHLQPADFFRSQIWYLLQNSQSVLKAKELNAKGKHVVLDSIVYSTLIFAQTVLKKDEFPTFKKLLETLALLLPQPDVVVYLYADTKFLFNVRRLIRIKEGTGPKTDAIAKFERIDRSNKLHKGIFGKWEKTPLIKVNVQKVDIKDPVQFEKLLLQIKQVAKSGRDGGT